MNTITKISAILACVTVLVSSQAIACEDKLTREQAVKLVQPFYDFFGGKSTEAQVRPVFAKDWKSYYGNGENDFKDLDQTLGFLGGPLKQMVPNLSWEIKDVMVTGTNQIIVRGEGSGIPAGDSFMGAPVAQGTSFAIMSIDIHTVEGGKIVKSYHLENWTKALKQLAANK